MKRVAILVAFHWFIGRVHGVSRAYPKGCSRESPEYYTYDSLQIPPPNLPARSHDDFALLRRLGAGKFSDVFEAVEVQVAKDSTSRNTCRDADGPASAFDPAALCVIKVSVMVM